MTWKRSLILCSIAAVTQAANLRGNSDAIERDDPPRLINAELINAFHDTYGWELVEYLQDQLTADYDPLYLGQETTMNASGFELPAYLPNCLQEAKITVGIGSLTGLSNLEVHGFEMIEGTEDIQFLGFMGSGGAIWNGTVEVNATFSSLTTDTTASVVADGCSINEKMAGTTVVSNATVRARITVGGRTDQWQDALCTTKVTHAHVESLDLSVGDVDLGLEGATGIVSMAMGFLESDPTIMEGMVEEMEPLMMAQVNQALDAQMPHEFCKEPAPQPPANNVTQPPTLPPTEEEIEVMETLPPTEIGTMAPTESDPPSSDMMIWWHPTLAVLLGLALLALSVAVWLRFFRNRETNAMPIKEGQEISC